MNKSSSSSHSKSKRMKIRKDQLSPSLDPTNGGTKNNTNRTNSANAYSSLRSGAVKRRSMNIRNDAGDNTSGCFYLKTKRNSQQEYNTKKLNQLSKHEES